MTNGGSGLNAFAEVAASPPSIVFKRLIPFSPVAPHVDAAHNLALVALEADRISL
jgi:hypothetical protein